MEVFEAIKTRRSVRAYLDRPVPKETLLKLLEAATYAPSAKNIQPWHFIIVTDKEKRQKLSHGRFAKFVTEAPVVIVACGDREASPEWHVVDVAIALQNIVLAAVSEGLGTCWVGSFNENEVKQELKIPERMKVVALLTIGYPRESFDLTGRILLTLRKRKPVSEVASADKFGQKFA